MKTLSKLALGITAAIVFGFTQAQAAIYFQDTFTYSDGPITNVSASGSITNWNGFSGASPVNVTNGHAIVSQNLTQDVAAQLTGSPHSNDILYAKFDFWADALPNATTSQFFLFKDSGTTLFLGRTFLTLTGAASGSYRLGVNASAGASPTAIFAQDIALGATNTAYFKIDQTAVSAPIITLWLNPSTEASASVSATGTLARLAISTVAFRQASGEGQVNIDNLVVGDSFVAIPEPSTVLLVGVGLVGMLALRRRSK